MGTEIKRFFNSFGVGIRNEELLVAPGNARDFVFKSAALDKNKSCGYYIIISTDIVIPYKFD